MDNKTEKQNSTSHGAIEKFSNISYLYELSQLPITDKNEMLAFLILFVNGFYDLEILRKIKKYHNKNVDAFGIENSLPMLIELFYPKYHFFYNGILSNFYPSKFVYKGVLFNCSEQAFQYEKAVYFNDTDTALKILQNQNPHKQKQLGQNVQGFNQEKWNLIKRTIMFDILEIRKCYDSDFREELEKLNGLKIVEASPSDRVWGIGFDYTEAIENIHSWGENILGEILTELSGCNKAIQIWKSSGNQQIQYKC